MILNSNLVRTPCGSSAERPRVFIDPIISLILPGSHSSTSAVKELASVGLVANSAIPITRSNALEPTNISEVYGAFAISGAFWSNAGAFGVSFVEAKVIDP